MDGIWRRIDEEELRTIVVYTSIKLRGLYDRVYEKLKKKQRRVTLKLSYFPRYEQSKMIDRAQR